MKEQLFGNLRMMILMKR